MSLGQEGWPAANPVTLVEGKLELDLADGLGEAEAVAWNSSFEKASGLVVGSAGLCRFTGKLRDRITEQLPALKDGFEVRNLELVCTEMLAVRDRLERQP